MGAFGAAGAPLAMFRRQPRPRWRKRRPGRSSRGPAATSRAGHGHNGRVAEFLIITGMSGAGRSQAGATLEDLGWFVIDNMPTALIIKVAELVAAPESTTDRVALVVGRDAEQLGELEAALRQLRARGSVVRTLFLEASDEVLLRRFEGPGGAIPMVRRG